MFYKKKPFAHVGIYPLANIIFDVLDCFCFCSQSLLHCKKKWKINACAKIISGIKVNVIYSVMYAIRNFLNGNDNWYSFLKNYIYFYPIFANIVTCEKKILDIYIFFIIFWLDICTENSKQNGVRFACFSTDTVLFSLLGVYVCSLDGVCNASLLIVSHLQTFH